MHASRSWIALGLAVCLAVSGCATVHLEGQYRPRGGWDIDHRLDKHVVADGGEWYFFWGLFDAGTFDVNDSLNRAIREDEVIANLTVEDSLSFGGFVLWLLTAGIVSHHNLTVTGEPALIRKPEAGTTAPPAGYPQGR